MRKLVKDNSFLVRQYDREKIFPNKKEIDRKAVAIRLTQNPDKQARHIFGTKEYNQAVKNRKVAPSYFTIPAQELDDIIQERADRSKAFGQFQYVDAKKMVGIYKDKYGDTLKTTRMKVMQSKSGYHAVPAVPKEKTTNDKRNNKNTR